MLKKKLFHYRSGYQRRRWWFNEIYNFSVSGVLLILSFPVFLLIMLVLWVRQGRPIFYCGARLGKNKSQFQMYKFRTLVRDAECKLNGELLGSRAELITPSGKFLRDTRLDELPQLWNVLKRDMDIAGPRPVRPEVYNVLCKDIPKYDRRFDVRPGIIGLSQVFTPHSTPKAIRSMIDNALIKKQEKISWNFLVLFLTSFLMIRSIIVRTRHIINRRIIQEKMLRRYREKRNEERIQTNNAEVYLLSTDDSDDKESYLGTVEDINSEALLLRSSCTLPDNFNASLKLKITVDKMMRGGRKTKRALCYAYLYRRTQLDNGDVCYVLMYQPLSPFNSYIIHQYFLSESVA